MRDSMEVSKGFGSTCQQILDFEAAFAQYCGTKHGIAVNSAGPGMDMAMRYPLSRQRMERRRRLSSASVVFGLTPNIETRIGS
jgi:hypothetical protein